jgi:hypothetical protein
MSLSIHGLGPSAYGLAPSEERTRTHEPGAEQRQSRAEARGADPIAEAGNGVDVRLWELLSTDERAFYLRSAASGPLTYGPTTKASASASPGRQVGGRIDVRV